MEEYSTLNPATNSASASGRHAQQPVTGQPYPGGGVTLTGHKKVLLPSYQMEGLTIGRSQLLRNSQHVNLRGNETRPDLPSRPRPRETLWGVEVRLSK